jgi:hypothetical protein
MAGLMKLDRHAQTFVESFGRYISTVRPYDRSDLRIHSDLLDIAERLEYGPLNEGSISTSPETPS